MHHVRTQFLEKKTNTDTPSFSTSSQCGFLAHDFIFFFARREFLTEILYKSIAIIAIQHSKMYFVDIFGDFSHTVE